MAKFVVMMHTDEGDFPYGKYEEKERAVEVSLEVQKERHVFTYISEIEED